MKRKGANGDRPSDVIRNGSSGPGTRADRETTAKSGAKKAAKPGRAASDGGIPRKSTPSRSRTATRTRARMLSRARSEPVAELRPTGRTGRAAGRRLHDNIARDIGIRIAAAELRPGDLLLGEIEASEQLAVSRTAYREAVRILAAKGMVESRTKTGTRVSPRERWHILDPEVLGWFLETKPSDRFVHDLFEIREMVEPHAAELAARNRSAAQLAGIGQALEDMDRLGLATEEGRAADRAFHQAILSASGNELIAALGSSVAAAIVWTTLFKHRAQVQPRNPIGEHRAVFEAIRDGDAAGARAAMKDVVQFAFTDMKNSLIEGRARAEAGAGGRRSPS